MRPKIVCVRAYLQLIYIVTRVITHGYFLTQMIGFSLLVEVVPLTLKRMSLKFIKSEKGRDMLVHRHFVYTFERVINNKTLWRCEYQVKKKCPGRVHTENNEVVKLSRREHNHLPDIAKLEAKRTVETIKTLAKSSEISSHAVLDTVSSQVNINTLLFVLFRPPNYKSPLNVLLIGTHCKLAKINIIVIVPKYPNSKHDKNKSNAHENETFKTAT